MADPDREIAASLDATPQLLPFLPALLRDVPALGCSVEPIVRVLAEAALERDARVLDLACGKGVVGLRLAQEFGCRVVGVDLFEPFIEEARSVAADMGLDDRCEFRVDDLRHAVSGSERFHAVVYSGVDALGSMNHCVARLRRVLVPGGYLVIDDGYLHDGVKPGPGYEHYCDRDETRRRLTSHGDRILAEDALPAGELQSFNRETTERIRRRAEQLAAQHPERAALFRDYVQRQEQESATLATDFVGAVWLLQKLPTGATR